MDVPAAFSGAEPHAEKLFRPVQPDVQLLGAGQPLCI